MTHEKNKLVNILDILTSFFTIVFLLTLSNSIFVNQIGYYGALLLTIVRYFVTKENKFQKTGLEIFFVLLILAEFLSSIFSYNSPQSFHNLLKRALLIPVVYMIIGAGSNTKQLKNYFKIFIAASLVGMSVYLFYAYQYYKLNIYQTGVSGPSLFKYSITSSEIMSFTFIFLFAFFINEKQKLKYKAFNLLLLIISAAALYATYKRTGWIGALAGVFIILFLKKKWSVLIPGFVLCLVFVLMQSDLSKVEILKFERNKFNKKIEYETTGRAYNILPTEKGYYLSDYNNGLVYYANSKKENKKNFSAPVIDYQKWNDTISFAYLIDTRFIKLNENEKDGQEEFLSPGYTMDFELFREKLFVLDSDEGITVFQNPNNIAEQYHFPHLKNFYRLDIDSTGAMLFSKSKGIYLFDVTDTNFIKPIITYELNYKPTLVKYNKGFLYLGNKNFLKVFKREENKLKEIYKNEKIKNSKEIIFTDKNIFVVNSQSVLFTLSSSDMEIVSETKLEFFPTGISFFDSKLYLTQAKQNRIKSIIDPYNPSNFNRLAFWRAGFLMFKDNPFFGVGDIDLAVLYKKYKKSYHKEIQGHLHNNYVHLLATLGGIGFIVAMGLFIKLFLMDLKIYGEVKNEKFIGSYSLGAIAAFSSFLVSGLTEWNFGDHEIITLVWFIFGLNIAFYKMHLQNNSNNGKKKSL